MFGYSGYNQLKKKKKQKLEDTHYSVHTTYILLYSVTNQKCTGTPTVKYGYSHIAVGSVHLWKCSILGSTRSTY